MCWPSVGGGDLTLGLENENFTGVLTSSIGPHAGCSISVTMSLALTIFMSVYFTLISIAELAMSVVECCLNVIDSGIRHPAAF